MAASKIATALRQTLKTDIPLPIKSGQFIIRLFRSSDVEAYRAMFEKDPKIEAMVRTLRRVISEPKFSDRILLAIFDTNPDGTEKHLCGQIGLYLCRKWPFLICSYNITKVEEDRIRELIKIFMNFWWSLPEKISSGSIGRNSEEFVFADTFDAPGRERLADSDFYFLYRKPSGETCYAAVLDSMKTKYQEHRQDWLDEYEKEE